MKEETLFRKVYNESQGYSDSSINIKADIENTLNFLRNYVDFYSAMEALSTYPKSVKLSDQEKLEVIMLMAKNGLREYKGSKPIPDEALASRIAASHKE